MTFAKFLKAVDYHLADLQNRNETGVYSFGCELNAGRPHHCDKKFSEQRVLRRTHQSGH